MGTFRAGSRNQSGTKRACVAGVGGITFGGETEGSEPTPFMVTRLAWGVRAVGTGIILVASGYPPPDLDASVLPRKP